MAYNLTARELLERERRQGRTYSEFESKFEARIEDSKEYKQYVRRIPYIDWDGKIPFDADVQVVPMKSIHLTTDNLERLIAEQEQLKHLLSDAEYGKKLVRELREDELVRNENPSVAKAYRNYQMLLELARK